MKVTNVPCPKENSVAHLKKGDGEEGERGRKVTSSQIIYIEVKKTKVCQEITKRL